MLVLLLCRDRYFPSWPLVRTAGAGRWEFIFPFVQCAAGRGKYAAVITGIWNCGLKSGWVELSSTKLFFAECSHPTPLIWGMKPLAENLMIFLSKHLFKLNLIMPHEK